MSDFLIFFDEIKKREGFKLEIYYSNVMDWCITVIQNEKKIISTSSCDKELVFAKAQVMLKDWLIENEGGY